MRARRFCAHAGSSRTTKYLQVRPGPANTTANRFRVRWVNRQMMLAAKPPSQRFPLRHMDGAKPTSHAPSFYRRRPHRAPAQGMITDTAIAHHVFTEAGSRKIMIASLRYLDTFAKYRGASVLRRAQAHRRLERHADAVILSAAGARRSPDNGNNRRGDRLPFQPPACTHK